MSLRDSFLSAKTALKAVEIEQWGITVYIRKWTARERTEFLKSITKIEGQSVDVDADNVYDQMVKLVQVTLCDENGERLFTDSEEDFAALNSKDADILEMLYNEASAFNGMAAESEKEAIKN